MSSLFHHKSIRTKFSLLLISACFAVLLLVTLLFAGIEYASFRHNSAEELETLATILGNHLTEPLLNKASPEAKQVLAALDTTSRIRAAYLFDRKYESFAQYLDPDSVSFVQKGVSQDFSAQFPLDWQTGDDTHIHFGLNYLSLYAPIIYQNKMIGGLYLLSDLSGIEQRLFGLLLVVLLAGGIAVGFAWLLAGSIQKPISDPILRLAETMHQVSTAGEFSIRAQKFANDEVGQLVDGFNEMLSQIEIRDLKIETHHKYLEQTVQERTAELTTTVADLDRAREQAESANQAKSLFLANMTHELRTPLVGVLGMNELLIEGSLSGPQLSLAESVQRSGQELLELINDILDFSKIEAGHLRLELKKIDLLKLIEEIVTMLAPRSYQKGIELISYVDPSAAWEVEADALRLRQILINLLGNAIKFTQQGHVGLNLTRSENGNFLFEVYDTGIGVEKENQSLIFEVFSQVDESTSRLFGGTGLGLSIVRDLTHMMHGSLALESEPGEGASFKVELPLKAVQSSYVRLPDVQQGRSVVLLEPYLAAGKSLQKSLHDLGFSAELVLSAEELLHRLEDARRAGERFDMAILSDCNRDGETELLAKVADACRIVVCQQKKLSDSEPNSSGIELLKPLLWGRLLQDDLFRKTDGACFHPPMIDPGPPRRAQVNDSAVKGRVMIVDDNASTRELIGLSLVGSGWLTENACNAEEALAAVEPENFQLILMDINMPGSDGLEVTRSLRQRGIATPIYALTAHGDARLFDKCFQAGMQGTLRKPFRQKELFALLEEHALGADRSRDTSGGLPGCG